MIVVVDACTCVVLSGPVDDAFGLGWFGLGFDGCEGRDGLDWVGLGFDGCEVGR